MTMTPVLKDLETAKYYCTLSLAEYKRPDPFAPALYVPLQYFKLPLPLELRDDTVVRYKTPEMLAVGDLMNTGGSTVPAEALRQAGDLINVGAGALVTGAGSVFGDIGRQLGSFVGGRLQQAFPAEAIGSAIQQSMGIAPNPNLSVALEGPELRDINLTWRLMAANSKDAANIRNLIKKLKAAALPQTGFSPSILGYPRICQVNFFPWDGKGGGAWGWGDDSIIKMKRCFMSSVSVNYVSGTAAAFFHNFDGDGNNEPIVTTLSIIFKEIEYFLSNDYDGFQDNNIVVDVGAGITEIEQLVGQAAPTEEAADS